MKMIKRYFFALVIVAAASGCVRDKTIKQPRGSTLPSLYVTLSAEQLDAILNDPKEKAPAHVLFVTAAHDTLYDDSLTHIKTRGNTSFKKAGAKKSFSIQFPLKYAFLGLDKSRSFALFANAFDDSHIRNSIAFDLAHDIGLPAPHYTYLSLYLNDEYKGLYQITNKVDVSKHTLRITDLDKLNKQANPRPLKEYTWFGYGRNKEIIQRKGALLECNPQDITGGYLLDMSGSNWIYVKSVSGFVSDAGEPIRIRSPKYATPEEVDYIATFYNQMESAIMSDNGYHLETNKYYTEYIDIESFALVYLLNELLLNQDGGMSSLYMYKDSDSIDSKLYAGPIWDFDRSIGNTFKSDLEIIVPNELYVRTQNGNSTENNSSGIFYYLWKHEDFQEAVKRLYYQTISPSCHKYIESGTIDSLADYLSTEAERDNLLYGIRKVGDYHSATKKALGFLQKRLAFLDWYFSAAPKDIVTINFQSNQRGLHHKMVPIYYSIGEPITILSSLRPHTFKDNHSPILELYLAGTDSIVQEGAVFDSPTILDLRYREPTRKEVQQRRVRKKLEKWGIVKPVEWEW